MSRIFLLRHAHSIANEKGILAGRAENIALSKKGIEESCQIYERLKDATFDQVLTSPLQRCLESIENLHLSTQIAEEFTEVDYGDWTGRKTAALMRNKAWREIHNNPASVRFPNGETLPEVQTRALLGLDLYLNKRAKNVLISTHADVVKVLILHALGTHLNNINKITIDNASISVIDKTENGYRVIKVNDTTAKIPGLIK